MTYHQHKRSTMPGLSNKAAPHCAIGGPPKSLPPSQLKRVVHFYWMKLCFLRHRPTVSDNSLAISTEMIKNNFCFYSNITVFENRAKMSHFNFDCQKENYNTVQIDELKKNILIPFRTLCNVVRHFSNFVLLLQSCELIHQMYKREYLS